jgi:hypothetical protein
MFAAVLGLATVVGCAAPAGDESVPEVKLGGVSPAAVTYDPATGAGFVGKGDVQLAFGWNNKQLQANAGGVAFELRSSTKYETECEKDGVKGTMFMDRQKVRQIKASLDGDPRQVKGQNQFTGFNLLGFLPDETVETPPTAGEICGGLPWVPSPTYAEGSEVPQYPVTATVLSGGLYAVHGGTRKLLPEPTPAAQ